MRNKLRNASILVLISALVRGGARGDSVAQVQTAKRISAETVALIDPESGSSSGGAGTDVRYAVGDILTFVFQFTPVPNGAVRGLGGYITEYVPPNTQVVGARIIDRNGNTVFPHRGGMAPDGWGTRGNGGYPAPFQEGSISQLYADTGIFYSTDPRTARNPSAALITVNNGLQMCPNPSGAGQLDDLLGVAGGPYYAHNLWDWIQARYWGGGNGNTEHLYGSAVAGPSTHYPFEASVISGSPPSCATTTVDVVSPGTTGPWQRIKYGGSETGVGGAVTSSGNTEAGVKRVGVPINTGWDLSVDNPLPLSTNAVRYAVGELVVGDEYFAEVSLRVLGSPLDPGLGMDANCSEVFGGDASARATNTGGKDHTWRYFLPAPACVLLNLFFELHVDKIIALGGETVTYTITGKNLSINPQTNVVITDQLVTGQNFVSATGGGVFAGGTITWPTIPVLAPGASFTYTVTVTMAGGSSALNRARYVSTQLPSPGFTTVALTDIGARAIVRLDLAAAPATVMPGGTVSFTGTIRNDGNGQASNAGCAAPGCQYIVQLPAGFTIVPGTSRVNGTLVADPTPFPAVPRYKYTAGLASVNAGATATLTFDAQVAGGTATGLYTSCLETWLRDVGFGQTINDSTCGLATVAVGANRSTPPVVSSPILPGAVCVSGTTIEADGSSVKVFVNGSLRATVVAAGGAWSACGLPTLYGGQEITATVTAPGELESALSAPVMVSNVFACNDGIDNDGDGFTDFSADTGCSAPTDDDETNTIPECSDTIDNDGDTAIDWPADPSCYAPEDPSETGPPQCSDGIDNDGDGLVDAGDLGCTGPTDPSEIEYDACADFVDNDGDGLTDFPDDLGCHSANDDDEVDVIAPPDIKARLLIAFDTSGSMNQNVCAAQFTGGDGSSECAGSDVPCATCAATGCGNGLADDSRLFKVKAGVADAVSGFGEPEYGLMRFHQSPQPFACPTQNASLSSGGWQGAGAAPCGGGYNSGDLVVGFSDDNQYDLVEWVDGDSNYPGVPPPGLDIELRGSGTTPLAGILGSALAYVTGVQAGDAQAACRPYRVILVTDGGETCGGDPVAAASALASAGIPVHVIGFATPDATIIANLNAIASAGGTGSAIFVDDSTALSAALAAIVTETILVELCNGLDDDCDGLIDEDFTDLGDPCDNGMLGTCRNVGVRVCDASEMGTTCTATPGTPGTEVCNGFDDDCNGLIDDGIICVGCASEICNGFDDDCDDLIDEAPLPGVGDSCGIDIGECQPGTLQCIAGALDCVGDVGPAPESCNGLDDDCDTIIDGMTQECYTFATGCVIGVGCEGACRTGLETCFLGPGFGPCVGEQGPELELCNGFDDDCDGFVDEDFPDVGDVCDNGMMGACLVVGTVQCLPDGSGTFCTAFPVTPGTEVCNGVDDDCDGLIDEDPLGSPIGEACGGGVGCTAGTYQCVMGMIECVGSSGGSSEVCNGVDDDCDGFIDEPLLPGVGEDCYTFPSGCMVGVGCFGTCQLGTTDCVAGMIQCLGDVGPAPEICNGLDDDCDGVGDDLAECPVPEDLCYDGQCVEPCTMDEFPCAFGFFCQTLPEGDFCLPDPCTGVVCPTGETCNPTTGLCEDLCAQVMCDAPLTCLNGFCVDCFTTGCADSCDDCVIGPSGSGECTPDPCCDVMCDAPSFCRDGQCVAPCEPECGPDQECVDGTCVDRPCSPEICDGQSCAPGMVCHPGTGACIADPCTSPCPDGRVCTVSCAGLKDCVLESDGEDILATGGGGCACRTGGGSSTPAGGLLLLCIGVPLALRLRRRSSR